MDRPVTLHFDDGTRFSDFTSWSLRETFSDPLGFMEFDAKPPLERFAEYSENLRKGRLVGCQVDGKPQAAMMIQTVQRRCSQQDGATIHVEAVTPLKQLYEASVDPSVSKSLAADAPIIDLVREVVDPFGIGEVQAEGDIAIIRSKTGKSTGATATNIEPLKYSEAQAQPNETAAAFLGRILSRLGVMLRMDAVQGAVYLTAPHYTGSPLYTVTQARVGVGPQGDRFFGEVVEVDTNEGQFSLCTVNGANVDQKGKTRAAHPSATTLTTEMGARAPYSADPALAYKPKLLRDTSCRDAVRAKRVSRLALGLPAERAYAIRGRVNGLVSRDGIPWTVDTLGRVYVEAMGIDDTFWLAERTMSSSKSEGSSTDLVWLPVGAFSIGDG